jgi:nitroreductase
MIGHIITIISSILIVIFGVFMVSKYQLWFTRHRLKFISVFMVLGIIIYTIGYLSKKPVSYFSSALMAIFSTGRMFVFENDISSFENEVARIPYYNIIFGLIMTFSMLTTGMIVLSFFGYRVLCKIQLEFIRFFAKKKPVYIFTKLNKKVLLLADDIKKHNKKSIIIFLVDDVDATDEDKKIENEIIQKILEAASTAPNGLGTSDVEVMVLDNKEKVEEFTLDLVNVLKKNKWLFSPAMLRIYRPFMGKENYDSLKSFAATALDTFINKYDEGTNWLTYSAPLAMFFHASKYADPADPYVAATYAMIGAQALGLGSCMLGTPNILLNIFGKTIKQKYEIPLKNKNGIMVIFGYPSIKYSFALKRRFANIKFH